MKMRTGDILTEEVFSSLAVAYHRTHNIKDTNTIGQSGFRAGGGKMYGVGIYLTYSFDDQQDERMKTTYGPFIIRCKINLSDFLIFDPDVAMRVYGEAKSSLKAQFDHFGIKYTGKPGDLPTQAMNQHEARDFDSVATGNTMEITSPAARTMAICFKKQNPKLKRALKGLVFTGRQDGRVIVAYDPSTIIPFAWARVINLQKTRETVKWNKIAAPPIRQATKPLSMIDNVARFFKTQGFTLISRGEKYDPGRTMLGRRGADYLTVIINQSYDRSYNDVAAGATRLRVQAYCTRLDPLATKLPGYAEHRGWPLIYKDWVVYETKDRLPLQPIIDTILNTHSAMKQHAEARVAFTEALLRKHILKFGVKIEREDKPGGDYRHDDIILRAGSVMIKLDSPYQDYTSGSVLIAAEPIDLKLGFGDGSGRGEVASLDSAYASLIEMVKHERIYERVQWKWPNDLQAQFLYDLMKELKIPMPPQEDTRAAVQPDPPVANQLSLQIGDPTHGAALG